MSETEPSHLFECMSCYKKFPKVFLVTAEDIQREKPPLWGLRVCTNCLERIRADARLESKYKPIRALLELSLLVPSILAVLVAVLVVALAFLGPTTLLPWRGSFFLGAATSLTGIRVVWGRAGSRYGSTHNLAWSVTSRDVVVGLSLVLSGALLATLAPIFL